MRRGVPEGGQARSMEVILKVGGLNLGGLRRLPRAEWVGKHQGVPYSWNPSGGSSLSLVL